MYDIIKTVIESGQFELTDILKKIDVQWISGKITEEERNELIQLAQEKANVLNSVDVIAKLAEMEKRMIAAEKEIIALKSQKETPEEPDATEPDTGEPEEEIKPETYPEYVAGKWYYGGDKASFEGENYTCIAPEGQVCTWNPVEYPPYWKKDGEEAEPEPETAE